MTDISPGSPAAPPVGVAAPEPGGAPPASRRARQYGQKSSGRPRNRGQTCLARGWRSARLFVRTLAAGIHRPWPPRTGGYVRS
jgi:hypothetical protein